MFRSIAAILLTGTVIVIVGCNGASATATPAPGPASALPATPLSIVAKDVAFTPASLGAPAGSPLAVHFDNQDAGIPHNLVLFGGPNLDQKVYESEIETGVTSVDFEIPGLLPGAYKFACAVHPNMTIALTIGA